MKKYSLYNIIKKVPAIFAFTLLANIGAGLVVGSWKASAYNSRIETVEKKVSRFEELPENLARIEGKLDVVLQLVNK